MKKSWIVFSLCMALLLSGCTDHAVQQTAPGAGTQEQMPSAVPKDADTTEETKAAGEPVQIDPSEMFSDRDRSGTYENAKSAQILLHGSSATCDSDAVQISGSRVTVTDEGTYILSGTLEDGMVIVNADKSDQVQLVLNGVQIHSGNSAAIYVLSADKVFLTLAPDSANTLINGETYVAIDENNIDAVIFSKADLTLNGSGQLTVQSPGGHGIVGKDDLAVTGGTYQITSASHGIAANDSVRLADATVEITSGKDGIHGENDEDASLGYVYIESGSYTVNAEGDGISAGNTMVIQDGSFQLTTGGGSVNASQQTSSNWGGFMGGGPGGRGGMDGRGSTPGSPDNTANQTTEDSTSIKGIKAALDLQINGGSFAIDSADDSLHSNSNITVNGGSFTIASGDDAFHADETLTVADGKIDISTSYEGLEGLHILVSGGAITLVATDDGLNAAGGTDQSGMGGFRGNDRFGGFGMGGGHGGAGGASNGSITISGGTLSVNASGDGIDANGSLLISGGVTTVCGPTQGDTATLDYDSSAIITGGTFIGTGASGMAQTFSDSEQGVLSLQVGNAQAQTQIALTDSSGKTLISRAPELSFNVVILSCPEMVKGEDYTITVGSACGTFTAN